MSPHDAQTQTAIGIRRHFTKKGVNPYDDVKWDRRDAKITNYLDGSVAFEQKGVEFPDSWSQNATNIVAQKYFYGTPGQKNREYSLKQLIDRVVDTITDHGFKQKYFNGRGEGEAFRAELKHILVTQKAAFNSPVWFNIGAPDRSQQASACFILAVEDTMESILNWYTEEGLIFKGGSGSGINLSTLRSSYEELASSGGTSSGPVSFMRGADAVAGTIKSGGKTRRAAKMVILNVDHPDVEEFIWTKAREERKIRSLRDAGFDMDLDGKDTHSVQYQNANNSVRVSDEFMQAVEEDRDWELKAIKTGKAAKKVRARELMRQISEAAWECADPGMQFDTTINRWHTASNTGRINASNPCSEYMHLDNSACNLASINLLKFLDNGVFDIEGFRQTAEVVFTAQEILVGYSSYPTEKITKNARAFRELGLGYANLGALLMALGLPYDSDDGRAWAATLTSLMTGHAYATSARIARRMGPFAGYADNREPMQKVLQMHRGEVSNIDVSLVPEELLSAAANAWDEAVENGRQYGVRNSQATVLAPTGTIGFMMDCDTTGIEPDLALNKTKKLVGGGTMSIVNQTVPRALNNLGYNQKDSEDIIAYIDENKTIIGAPHIKKEHLPVFATSMGEENTIHYTGHVKMMAAVQPFISGAISKTVNMPEEVTVEDVEQLHIDAWKMGLKAVAIYRDNCKVAQPLATTKKEGKQADDGVEGTDNVSDSQPAQVAATESEIQATKSSEAEGFKVRGPVRRELPRIRNSKTFKFYVADCKGFFTVGEFEDGKPGEVFINSAKQGSTLSGLMDSFAIAISHSLQWGVPLKDLVHAFINTNFTPAGMTDDPDVPLASSLVDYIFRRLALEYLPQEDLLELGLAAELQNAERNQASLLTDEETTEEAEDTQTETEADQPAEAEPEEPADEAPEQTPVQSVAPRQATKKKKTQDAPLCYNCGNPTQRAGSCYVCTACGTTSGCS